MIERILKSLKGMSSNKRRVAIKSFIVSDFMTFFLEGVSVGVLGSSLLVLYSKLPTWVIAGLPMYMVLISTLKTEMFKIKPLMDKIYKNPSAVFIFNRVGLIINIILSLGICIFLEKGLLIFVVVNPIRTLLTRPFHIIVSKEIKTFFAVNIYAKKAFKDLSMRVNINLDSIYQRGYIIGATINLIVMISIPLLLNLRWVMIISIIIDIIMLVLTTYLRKKILRWL